jgi:hypothetical protein
MAGYTAQDLNYEYRWDDFDLTEDCKNESFIIVNIDKRQGNDVLMFCNTFLNSSIIASTSLSFTRVEYLLKSNAARFLNRRNELYKFITKNWNDDKIM